MLSLREEEVFEVVVDDEAIDLMTACCNCWSLGNFPGLRNNWDAKGLSLDTTGSPFDKIEAFEVEIEVVFAYLLR